MRFAMLGNLSSFVATTTPGTRVIREVRGLLLSKKPSGKESCYSISSGVHHEVYSENYKCHLRIQTSPGQVEEIDFGTSVGYELIGQRVLYRQTEEIERQRGSSLDMRHEKQELFVEGESEPDYYFIRHTPCPIQA